MRINLPTSLTSLLSHKYFLPFVYGLAGVLVVVFLYLFLVSPPKSFPRDTIVSVESGSGLLELSESLKEDGVIRSALIFKMVAIALGGERAMQAGEYHLSLPQNSVVLARRVVRGDYQVRRVKVTIPEGFTVQKISSLFGNEFEFFDNSVFELSAPEGYLFPDTYFIPVSATATTTIALLRDNFINKIFDLMPAVEASGRTLEEVITMASIIEGEARRREDREMIAGILWKRYDIGMPLQVDASFVYILGKGSADLTLQDLKLDSPYNSYTNKGLPPTPISNPGLDSIEATLNPVDTQYLYFLTGKDGKMYYARTHDEHVANKQKYLR